MRSHAIAFATHKGQPEITADDRRALPAIAERCGASVHGVPWDAPGWDWGRYAAVLIRSTWDYHLRPEAFFAWAEGIETAGSPLWNPAPVLRWNADKRYLRDVERAGAATIPTEWIPRGAAVPLESVMRRRGWRRVVVKPSISATSFRTWMTDADQADSREASLTAMVADADAMVQPFLPEVARQGEWSFVFFANDAGALVFSHAVRKRAAAGDFRVQSDFGGTVEAASPPSPLVREVARVAATIGRLAPGPLLYARLDGVVSDGVHAPAGAFLLMEAELIEPMLFLAYSHGAAERLAQALARRLAASQSETS